MWNRSNCKILPNVFSFTHRNSKFIYKGLRQPNIRKFIRRIDGASTRKRDKWTKGIKDNFNDIKQEIRKSKEQKQDNDISQTHFRRRSDPSRINDTIIQEEVILDSNVKKLTRREVVAKLLPKLAYIICDVILFVTTNEINSDFSVYDRCMQFAIRANAFIQDADRPALVIVHNKCNISDAAELDVNTSTRLFLETFDPELKLTSYFSTVNVVRVPMLGEAYDNQSLRKIWDQQMTRLECVIESTKLIRTQHRMTMNCQLTNKLWFKVR